MTYPPNGPYDQPTDLVPGFDTPPAGAPTHPMPPLELAPEAAPAAPAAPSAPAPQAPLAPDPPPAGYAAAPPDYAPPEYAPPEYAPRDFASRQSSKPAKSPKRPKAPKPPKPAKQPRPPGPPMSRVSIAIWTFAAISVAGIVLGLSIKENHVNAWHSVHAWGAVAIAAAAATAAPAFGAAMRLRPDRAWQVAAAGAGVLGFFWILFVLPGVGSNTSLLATVGVVSGVIAAWLAPGRHEPTEPGGGAHSASSW